MNGRTANMNSELQDAGLRRRISRLGVAVVALLVVALTVLIAGSVAQAQIDDEPVDTAITHDRSLSVRHTLSCLAGLGRLDTHIVNPGSEPAQYTVRYEGLSPRTHTVGPDDFWRLPITGRQPGDATVTVERNGEVVSTRTVTIDCDAEPTITTDEVEFIIACRGESRHRGYVLIELANATDESMPYVIEWENIRNRSTTAAPWAQSVKAVSGRPSGVHAVRITSTIDGQPTRVVFDGSVEVDCPYGELPVEPEPTVTPTPTPRPEPIPTPPPASTPGPDVISPGLPIRGGADAGGIVPPGGGPILPPPGGGTPQPEPQAGLLTAAEIDDNLNHEQFLGYLENQQQDGAELPSANLADRLGIDLVDTDGDPVRNHPFEIRVDGERSLSIGLVTDSTGRAWFYPHWTGLGLADAYVVTTGSEYVVTVADLADDRLATITIDDASSDITALDVAFVIDTTGSMGDELQYLKTEFAAIVDNVVAANPGVDLRFGLVAYRDLGDAYVTRTFDFASAESFLVDLEAQVAQGGGDYPEAMEAALAEANGLAWRDGVSKAAILNADAPPHDENLQAALDEATALGEKGVRVYPLAASGVADTAEYLMRIMAATTSGRHLFLTDDSGIGGDHQEPKVACYVVTRLDQLLVRVLASEIAGERLEPAANDIIRTVGDYDNGVCGDPVIEPGPPLPPEARVIGTADLNGEPIDGLRHPIEDFVIAESYPEQITITFTAGPELCTAAVATATAIGDQVVLDLQLGTPEGGEDIACVALAVQHRLTMQLTEGLDGREVVVAPIRL